jgi:hypothetical protein
MGPAGRIKLEAVGEVNEPPTPGDPNLASENYVERLKKYIPAEVIAAYMTLAGIVKSSSQPNDPLLHSGDPSGCVSRWLFLSEKTCWCKETGST